jgi:uncharacterized membrane protein (UPF0127 family)
MRRIRTLVLLPLALSLACSRQQPATMDDLQSAVVILPGGQKIKAERMVLTSDLARGMMFRDSLAADRGMLFFHEREGNYSYWMYQTRIPLDIIWMDRYRRIVEISANAPPCKTAASQCAHYGGNQRAQYVLELAGGMASKYGLKAGDILEF